MLLQLNWLQVLRKNGIFRILTKKKMNIRTRWAVITLFLETNDSAYHKKRVSRK